MHNNNQLLELKTRQIQVRKKAQIFNGEGVTNQWNKLPREAVNFSSLGVFESWLDVFLEDIL